MLLSDHVFLTVPCLACGASYQVSLAEIRARHEVGIQQLTPCSSCAATTLEQVVPLDAIEELERAWDEFLAHIQGPVEIH